MARLSEVLNTNKFIPRNYNTRANNFTREITNMTGNTNTAAWYSGEKTYTVPDAPADTVAILVELFANANLRSNNQQRIFVYKNSEATAVGRPTTGIVTAAKNLSDAEVANLNDVYKRVGLDPTSTEREAEHSVTVLIYVDTVLGISGPGTFAKQFKWFWIDMKTKTSGGGTPTANPDYRFEINTIGYIM